MPTVPLASRSPLALGSVLVLVLSACGEGPFPIDDPDSGVDGGPDAMAPTTAESEQAADFFDRYTAAYCSKLFACEPEYAGLGAAACQTILRAEFESSVLEEIESGNGAFDEGRGEACLELLEASEGCAFEWSEEYCLEDSGPFVGTLPAGAGCDSDAYFRCSPGTRCSAERFSGACGVCEAFAPAALGEPCEFDSDCQQSATALAYCGDDPIDARAECLRWTNPTLVGLGEDCGGDEFCAIGLECAWDDDDTCIELPSVGDECDVNGSYGCAGGAECLDDAVSSLGGLCHGLGFAFEAGDDCGLVGDELVECAESARLVCDEGSATCVHVAGVAGDPCDVLDCASGFHCDSLDESCTADLTDGSACDDSDECMSGACSGPDGMSVCGSPSSVAGCTP